MSGCHSKLGGTADTHSSLSCLWQGFFISFKEPRPKVAGEFRVIDADGAKARSTFLSKEGDMKQSFETSKLYYGFPIFILGYQDQAHGYNVTTCSSSYSLGDWL
ncbi:MAG: flavin reductase family protein, partial [Streptococcus salivarius]